MTLQRSAASERASSHLLPNNNSLHLLWRHLHIPATSHLALLPTACTIPPTAAIEQLDFFFLSLWAKFGSDRSRLDSWTLFIKRLLLSNPTPLSGRRESVLFDSAEREMRLRIPNVDASCLMYVKERRSCQHQRITIVIIRCLLFGPEWASKFSPQIRAESEEFCTQRLAVSGFGCLPVPERWPARAESLVSRDLKGCAYTSLSRYLLALSLLLFIKSNLGGPGSCD